MRIMYSTKHLRVQLILSSLWLVITAILYAIQATEIMYGFIGLFLFGMWIYIHNALFGCIRVKGDKITLFGKGKIRQHDIFQMKRTDAGVILYTRKKKFTISPQGLNKEDYDLFLDHLNRLGIPWV